MKKIDLHIHTLPAEQQDVQFEFDIEKLQEYIDVLSLDAIAITNHNLFNLEQFQFISNTLQNVSIFPGIEINFEKGHLLLIADNNNLDDFNQKCLLVSERFNTTGNLTVAELKEIFSDLGKYLLIPHYEKTPKVPQDIIDSLKEYIYTGEVKSPKKFYRLIKEYGGLTPVLFSDARIKTDLDIEKLQGRQTFIKNNAEQVTFSSIAASLKDKNKVFISKSESHDFFQVFSDGQELSHGLNIVLGKRSSGKTHLLDKLKNTFDEKGNQIKYIKQFSLVDIDESKFNEILEKERSDIREKYLERFRSVVDDVIKIDRQKTHRKLQDYTASLIEFAKSEKRQDEFSKSTLFTETPFTIHSDNEIERILKAIKILIQNETYKSDIEKYLPENNLKSLFDELKTKYKKSKKELIKKEWVNELIENIAQKLHYSSSSPNIKYNDIDFYQIKIENEKIKRFNAIAKAVQRNKDIDKITFGEKFTIKAQVGPFDSVQELRDESGTRNVAFRDVFKHYGSPFTYLTKLKELQLETAGLYRFFCKVRYHVLNEYGKKVSGGEQSEFNLLRELQDARQFEMLLIDEPEASFDNVFLKENVNKIIKDISKELPVVVVTHNNTVGMLMQPDYILYTSRETVTGRDEYYLYSSSPGDLELKTADKLKTVKSYDILLETLEAGVNAYDARSKMYNDYKNKN